MDINKLSINELLQKLILCETENRYEDLLTYVNFLLLKDPNNSDLLLYKIKAFEGLGTLKDNINTIQNYINVKSTDATGFLLLHQAYIAQDYLAGAIIALVYALSIEPDNEECLQVLLKLIQKVDKQYTQVKLNIMTTDRIGHLACEIEPLLRKTQNEQNCLYLFLSQGDCICNTYLYDLIKNNTNIIEDKFWFNLYVSRPLLLDNYFFAEYPYDINSSLRGASVNKISNQGFKNLIDIYQNFPRYIYLPEEDIHIGYDILANYGINKEDKIVCLHVRDSAYLAQANPNIDFSYHDYRDADISTYKDAVEFLINDGYKVIRFGATTNQRLEINSANYIDFSIERSKEYGDFLEIFLLNICDFYVGNYSGPYGIAAMFDTPTLVVNGVPFGQPYCKYGRFIPKRLFQKGEEINIIDISRGKALSSSNAKPIYLSFNQNEFSQYGYQYIDNNMDDITDAVIEFEQQVSNRMLDMTLTDKQKNYYDALPESFCHKNLCVISDSFLTTYQQNFIVE